MLILYTESGIEFIPPSVYAASVLKNSPHSDNDSIAHKDHSDNMVSDQQP